MTVTIEFQPIGRRVKANPGESILEVAQDAGIGLSAICGGNGSCGACKVRLDKKAKVSEPDAAERKKLTTEEFERGLRLACRTKIQGDVVVDVPASSLSAPQRAQVEGQAVAFEFDPAVKVYDVELAKPVNEDTRADWERLNTELVKAGAGEVEWPGLTAIKEFSPNLRESKWAVRTAVVGGRAAAVFPQKAPVLGLAVDLGTTKIAGYLADMETGRILARDGVMNPQIAYGEDVIARIFHAMEKEDGLDVLQSVSSNGLSELAENLCAGAVKAGELPEGTTARNIVEAVVVGNTAMHHIFLGLPVRQLGISPYVAAVTRAVDVSAADIGLRINTGGNVHLLPNVAGFVGADHVSMMLATGHHRKNGGVIMSLDIGTNTEITLAAEDRLIACSTASGPAFEGANIRYGMRAAKGAIERIQWNGGGLTYQTVDGAPAVGICGSGVLDAVAVFRSAGILNVRGSLEMESPLVRKGEFGPEVLVVPAADTGIGEDICLSRKDIGEIQLAKGAIRAGMEMLLEQAGLDARDLDKVVIAGAFGTYIDVDSAITVGLLPPLPKDRVHQVGNAAGMGAVMSLLSKKHREEARQLANSIEYLELSGHPGFQEKFMRAMLV